MTPELLRAATGCTPERAALFAGPLTEICAAYGINTPARLAAFLAQLGHESASLRYVREIATGAAYEGRKDLGNTQPGDGTRYRGRGLIQVTGRFNYQRATQRLRAKFGAGVPDFEADPEALEQPRWAAFSAGDYWDAHILNTHADRGDFETITRAINGGLNGQADRLQRWERAKAALAGAAPEPTPVPIKQLPPATAIAQAPQPEANMPPLIAALGQSLISIFAPLAAEKIQKEIGRHVDNPAIAEQMTTAVVDAAIAATGKADPIEAVAAAKANPAILAQVEQSALDKLSTMAPFLNQLAELEAKAWQAEEASRATARQHNADDPLLIDAPWLKLKFIHVLSLALVSFSGWFVTKNWDSLTPELKGAVITLMIIAGWTGVKDYWMGSSRSSAAKDVVIGELSKRKTTT